MVKNRNNWYEFFVIIEEFIFIYIWWMILQSLLPAIAAGALTYLVLSKLTRQIFLRYHKKGMDLLRQKDLMGAAAAFQQSYEYFRDHEWVDRYRYLTMFSSSKLPFRDIALNNVGMCHLHSGDPETALDVILQLYALNPAYPDIDKTLQTIRERMEEQVDPEEDEE